MDLRTELSGDLPNALVVTTSDLSADSVTAGLKGFAKVRLIAPHVPGDIYEAIEQIKPIISIFVGPLPDMDLLEVLQHISETYRVPSVVFEDSADSAEAKRAVRAGASAYIVDGLSTSRVRSIVEVAMERFRLTDTLHQELQRSKEDLAARKTIERAKGLLMERRGLSEQEAYNALRKTAMGQGKSIRDVAEAILSISNLLP